MGMVKFQKGSEEWVMFMDFWALCQKYWTPEKEDAWWDDALGKIDDFAKKYGDAAFARGLGMALVKHLEASHNERMRPGREEQR